MGIAPLQLINSLRYFVKALTIIQEVEMRKVLLEAQRGSYTNINRNQADSLKESLESLGVSVDFYSPSVDFKDYALFIGLDCNSRHSCCKVDAQLNHHLSLSSLIASDFVRSSESISYTEKGWPKGVIPSKLPEHFVLAAKSGCASFLSEFYFSSDDQVEGSMRVASKLLGRYLRPSSSTVFSDNGSTL